MLVYNTNQAYGCNGQHVQGFIAGPGWIIPNSAGTQARPVVSPSQLFKCWLQAPTSSKPETYQVPPNFDKSILGEVDVSSKDAAELGLPHAFWLRWMQLREQVRAFPLLPTVQCCARRVSCSV